MSIVRVACFLLNEKRETIFFTPIEAFEKRLAEDRNKSIGVRLSNRAVYWAVQREEKRLQDAMNEATK